MNALEQTQNFFQDPYIRKIFEVDLAGLKNAETVIMLLPAGTSVHMEAGIAYGLGKRLILPEKTGHCPTATLPCDDENPGA